MPDADRKQKDSLVRQNEFLEAACRHFKEFIVFFNRLNGKCRLTNIVIAILGVALLTGFVIQAVCFSFQPPLLRVSKQDYLNNAPKGTYTLAVIPDTQRYYGPGAKRESMREASEEPRNPSFDSRTVWLSENIDSQRIVFVSHMGDIVDINNHHQWQVARENMDRFHGVVPYGITVGNHDMSDSGNSSLFQEYFGAERYEQKDWYGGTYKGREGNSPQISGNNANSYQFFSAGNLEFIIVHVECNAPDDVLQWVDGVLQEHNDKMAIIATHMYLGPVLHPLLGGTDELGRMEWSKSHGSRGNTPRQMWQKSFSKHPNLFMILAGDQSRVISYRQQSRGQNGNLVYEIMQDYPRSSDEDDWIRLFRIYPEQKEIKVWTYSPAAGMLCGGIKHLPEIEHHQFALDISEAVNRYMASNK